MKCYLCAEEGKDTEAIAICIVCGMGVCKEHHVKDQISFWEAQFMSSDLSPEGGRFTLPKSLPRILCIECYEAIKRR
ncbi:MAG: DUF2180 family protein [Methanobacteriota archaeon]|nr:MAG: DUF2180 family protein [Euryarchaeota archaeon]